MAKKSLVVYFSMSGNTQKIAEKIATVTNSDMVRINVVEKYNLNDDEVNERCKFEADNRIKPAIESLNVNLSDYERIIVGTPTWWYTMAPAVLTFLSGNDFSNKEVVLYMTNAGWAGTVIKDMISAAKGAKVLATKEILFDTDGGNQMVTPDDEIDAWINSWQQ
ncbi:MAG: flavodoxin [Alphaproteobacteria bacterium]|nr:flavodoxin [Alphaproteobacteria bacterium]